MPPSTTTAGPSPVPPPPSPKRPKLSHDVVPNPFPSSSLEESLPTGAAQCLRLLSSSPSSGGSGSVGSPSLLPSTLLLPSGPAGNDLQKVKSLFDMHGFRTSVVTSPRSALSVYRDSCHLDDGRIDEKTDDALYAEGREFLVSMLGMHPHQRSIERLYGTTAADAYRLLLFCRRVREACPKALESEAVASLIEQYEAECATFAHDVVAPTGTTSSSGEAGAGKADSTKSDDSDSSPRGVVASPASPPLAGLHRLSSSASEKRAALVAAVVTADPRVRPDQLGREYDRIAVRNSTYANALVQIFLGTHGCTIKDVYFKRSHVAKFERISIYLYDPDIDLLKPPGFTFLPGLRRAIDDGPEALADDMVDSFWANLLRHGYFATRAVRESLSPEVRNFFLSGLSSDPSLPLLLNAHFAPTYPLSLYLHGKAGAGKSSLVRNFSPSLNGAIEEHADPDILVRFVKQNLNKPQRTLELELELRPNNNDLSVMSIIQGRRMTLAQAKPGLVVVGLEEIASDVPGANPNQSMTCRLISQRFSGRNGQYREDTSGGKKDDAPRNSARRGISGDASLLALFTSNYTLGDGAGEALRRLDMFKNLRTVEMTAVSGRDRADFARTYIMQCIQDRFDGRNPRCELDLNVPVGSGDTRPLVRHLRMLSFFVCTLAASSEDGATAVGPSIHASIIHDDETNLTTVRSGDKSIQLKLGSFDNLYPTVPRVYAPRAAGTVSKLRELAGKVMADEDLTELTQIMDFYFHKTLAPAVVVSNDGELIRNIVRAVSSQDSVHAIMGVDPLTYKMMKSLYDPNDTPNLRDDILKFGRGAYVAVEMKCSSRDAQQMVREIIEDSPSLTAFSTNKSALYKEGLFFGVHVEGELTPEIRSRASLIL